MLQSQFKSLTFCYIKKKRWQFRRAFYTHIFMTVYNRLMMMTVVGLGLGFPLCNFTVVEQIFCETVKTVSPKFD